MSFGKLLATGKSLVGGHHDARYRTNVRAVLPKFVSLKNPFAPAPNKDGAASQVVSPGTPVQSLSPQAADSAARAVPSRSASGAAHASVWSRIGQWLVRVAKRLNPLAWFFRPPQTAKSVIPRFGHKPVQAELHLEKVRVMRNDLRDADLEVVQVGASGNKNLPSGTAWSQLSARIFGPGPTD